MTPRITSDALSNGWAMLMAGSENWSNRVEIDTAIAMGIADVSENVKDLDLSVSNLENHLEEIDTHLSELTEQVERIADLLEKVVSVITSEESYEEFLIRKANRENNKYYEGKKTDEELIYKQISELQSRVSELEGLNYLSEEKNKNGRSTEKN